MRDHTSLLAWQEARAVVLGMLELSHRNSKRHARPLFDQGLRSSLSVQLNIAEGYAFMNSPTCRRHLRTAYGSAIETGDVLPLLSDASLAPEAEVVPLLERCRRSQRLLLGLIHGWK